MCRAALAAVLSSRYHRRIEKKRTSGAKQAAKKPIFYQGKTLVVPHNQLRI
jgi:hypothetical protein